MTDRTLLLLAEDEALIRMMLEDDLRDAGFDLVTVSDGRQGLTEIEADAARFRAVVTDIRLGKGPYGWALARRARAILPDIAVVYMSGDSAHEWSAQGVPNSVMVPKPFVAAQIVTALSTLLAQADNP